MDQHGQPGELARRTLLCGSAAVAAAGLLPPSVAVAAPGSGGELLGIPMTTVNVRAGTATRVGDREAILVFSNGSPGVINVLDAATGERLASHDLDGYESSYGIAEAPDGSVYLEGRPRGRLFRYFPTDDRLDDLGKVLPEAWTIPAVAVDHDGVVYGGTSTTGQLFSYDPGSGTFTDHGVVAEGETFTHVGAVHDGVVWVGTQQSARFFEIDVARGEKREIALPPPYDSGQTRAMPKGYRDGIVFLYLSPSHTVLVYHTRTGEWVDELSGQASAAGPTTRSGRYVYAEDRESRHLWAYHPTGRFAEQTDFATSDLGSVTRVIGLGSLDEPDYPGDTVVGVGETGRMWHWNPTTKASRWLDGDVRGGPAKIRAIGTGPDGNLFMGGFFTSGVMARYSVADQRLEQFDGPTQIEGFGTHDDKLYFGTYTGAGIMQYDPAAEWSYGTNPRQLFALNEYGQERPWAFAGVGDRLAIGTTASGGSLDGALTFYTPATDEVDHVGNLFPGEGVTSLAAYGSLLAGGSSTRVSGTNSTVEAPHLFLFDTSSDELVWDGVPFEDARDIPALAFDADGRLWGLTNNARVFGFDTTTHEVTGSTIVTPDSDASGGMPTLLVGPDGALYGATGPNRVLFRVDPESMEAEILDTEAGFAALGGDGAIYYAKDEVSLARWEL